MRQPAYVKGLAAIVLLMGIALVGLIAEVILFHLGIRNVIEMVILKMVAFVLEMVILKYDESSGRQLC
jgi:hypothetical protein